MSAIGMKQLLEAGVHFGHQTRRWNPKMAPYIYTERNGIHIIDLQKTVKLVDDSYNALSQIVANGGTVLFVGTKKQAQDAVKAEALRCGEFYVNERWLGGMLTNFKTIRSRIQRLKDIEKMAEDGTFDVLPKKEVTLLGITIFGLADTNVDPEELDYIIPGNDDAIRAIKLIVAKMADAVIEAKQGDMTEEEAALASSEEDFSKEEE